MSTIRTAYRLELLLHCYYSNNEHPQYRTTPAVPLELENLKEEGMICVVSASPNMIYEPTGRGKFYIEHLLNTEFPEVKQIFFIPNAEDETGSD